jgi:AraC-like DNA-binding protein
MASSKLSLHHYSTASLSPADRHEAWTQRDWPSLAPAFRTAPLEPFNARSTSVRLGELSVHYSHITGQRWTRDSGMMKSYDPDALAIAITVAGRAEGEMGSQAFRTGPGSVHFSDLSVASDHRSTASHTLLIAVPRQTAEQNGLDVRALSGTVLDSGPATLIAPFLLGLRRAAPGLIADDAPRLGKVVLDLLSLAASRALDREPQVDLAGRRTALSLAARREIETSLGSPKLSVAALCRRLDVSRSTLHRLFEADGGVQAYIRERRLEAARFLLDDGRNAEPIYAIAERLGFSDAAHLSRLFRQRYGLPPSEYRSRSRDGVDPRA